MTTEQCRICGKYQCGLPGWPKMLLPGDPVHAHELCGDCRKSVGL